MPNILYLHGANMTETGFTYIKSVLGSHKSVCPEYSIHTPLKDNISDIIYAVKSSFNKPVTIISHSLGGIIAMELLRAELPIEKIVTMSSPFRGSVNADNLRWFFPSYQLLDDIRSNNTLIRNLRDIHIDIPMLSFVSTSGGTPMASKYDNDGVVSIRSQKHLSGPTYKEVPFNHFEILLSKDVATQIKSFIKK